MTEQAMGGEIEMVSECSKEKRQEIDRCTLEILVTGDELGFCIILLSAA